MLLSGAAERKSFYRRRGGEKKAITEVVVVGDGDTQRLSSGIGVSRLSSRSVVLAIFVIYLEYFLKIKNGLGRFFFPFSASERRRRQWWLYYEHDQNETKHLETGII